MYKHHFIRSASLAGLLALSSSVFAQDTVLDAENSNISTDFTLPVTLDSKSQALDGKNKTSIFIDNVVIRQGSLELLADRVEVDAAGGTGNEVIIASGQPASYKQRKDDGTWVEAKADEIIYEVASRTISLDGNALIMQNEVRVTGDLIVFDMTKEQILASTNDNSSESVRTVISPGAFAAPQEQNKQDENEEDQP